MDTQSTSDTLLKKDLFGEIRRRQTASGAVIERDTRSASPWLRWLARRLLQREANALLALDGLRGIPAVLEVGKDVLRRGYLPGEPLNVVRRADANYFRQTARLLRRMHRLGVVHNDLAKEPNLLILESGEPAIIDYQLAWYSPRRGRLFRWLAYEDIRHLLKHKRSYQPDQLSQRERAILANPGLGSRVFRRTLKPVYLVITRRLLGWSDREGAGNRGDVQR